MVLFRFEISLPCPWYFRLKNRYMNEGNGSVQFFRIDFYIRWAGISELVQFLWSRWKDAKWKELLCN